MVKYRAVNSIESSCNDHWLFGQLALYLLVMEWRLFFLCFSRNFQFFSFMEHSPVLVCQEKYLLELLDIRNWAWRLLRSQSLKPFCVVLLGLHFCCCNKFGASWEFVIKWFDQWNPVKISQKLEFRKLQVLTDIILVLQTGQTLFFSLSL